MWDTSALQCQGESRSWRRKEVRWKRRDVGLRGMKRRRKGENENEEDWPVIYQNNGCMKWQENVPSCIIWHIIPLWSYIYLFFSFDTNTCPFKCPKIEHKHNHLHLKVLSQGNHREGHPPPPLCKPLSLPVINGVIIFPLLTLFPFW